MKPKFYTCKQCDYTSKIAVSGKEDYGTTVMETFICFTCKELIEGTVRTKNFIQKDDLFPGKSGNEPFSETFIYEYLLDSHPMCIWCETNNNTKWHKWKKPCPRCSGTLVAV